ncbi:MAG: FAD-dependent oxidoreductase [Myxococcota bacterium]|nr:FAD-dependent oxidoreductase [Myxococcota bacterium]
MASVDVLVVGAGPTGLTLACELARRGLSVRVVDDREGPSTTSKAIAVHARTLEILEDMEIAEQVIARGVKLRGVTMWAGGEVIVSADFDELETRFNYLLSVSQADTEALLIERLAALGVAIERKSKLVGLRQDGTGVTATVQKDGTTQPVRAAWLVGCDGARSTVRKALELPFEGSTYDERFLLADLKVRWDVRDDRIATYFADDGVVACFPMKEGRWRVVASATPGDESDAAPTLEEMQTLFQRRTGTGGVLSDATWLAKFRIHCRSVGRYRDDRVFLAGDAAHVHSPVGGQGMNVGMQDAHNLGWKLALVHGGHARGLLLDSYETERLAVAQAMLKSTDVATKVGTLKSSVARATRNEVARFLSGFEFVQQRITREVAELTVGYENSPIVREDRISMLSARIGSAAGGETPTIGSLRDFEAGPHAGARAPDGRATLSGKEGTRRIAQVIDGRSHTLLIFDGRHHSDEAYARYAKLEAAVRARYPEQVRTFVVTPHASRPAQLPEEIPVLLDPDGDLEKRYAASTECLYLIRPDLYVGYRSQPVDEAKLMSYLASILR